MQHVFVEHPAEWTMQIRQQMTLLYFKHLYVVIIIQYSNKEDKKLYMGFMHHEKALTMQI